MTRQALENLPALSIPSSARQSLINTPSSLSSTPILSARPIPLETKTIVPGESADFFTALAAQERQVLELREELRNAETELERLKKQWALREVSKERSEVQQLEQLQLLSKSISSSKEMNYSDQARIFKDQERQRATKSSQRKVFSGSKHARTLSLLSPTSTNSLVMPIAVVTGTKGPQKNEDKSSISNSLPQKVIASAGIRKTPKVTCSHSAHELPRDAILETGKQLVGDIREGLWTFFEDLKQATVGDEATSALIPRKSTSAHAHSARNQAGVHNGRGSNKSTTTTATTNNHKKVTKTEPADNQIIKIIPKSITPAKNCSNTRAAMAPSDGDQSVTKPTSIQASPQQTQNQKDSDDDDDEWDNWDSPKPKHPPVRWSTGSTTSLSTASTPSSHISKTSPRTSTG